MDFRYPIDFDPPKINRFGVLCREHLYFLAYFSELQQWSKPGSRFHFEHFFAKRAEASFLGSLKKTNWGGGFENQRTWMGFMFVKMIVLQCLRGLSYGSSPVE